MLELEWRTGCDGAMVSAERGSGGSLACEESPHRGYAGREKLLYVLEVRCKGASVTGKRVGSCEEIVSGSRTIELNRARNE